MKKSPGRKAKRAAERKQAHEQKAAIRKLAEQRKQHEEEERKKLEQKFKDFAKTYVEGELRERFGEPKAESDDSVPIG